MAAAYSMDLRTRVLRDADAGLTSKELAERYHVSRAWVDALKQRRRETGSFAPREADEISTSGIGGGGHGPAEPHSSRARPDATLAELREALRASAGLTTIWRALNQLDFTVKKNGIRRRTTAARRRR